MVTLVRLEFESLKNEENPQKIDFLQAEGRKRLTELKKMLAYR